MRQIGSLLHLYLNESGRKFPKPNEYSYDGWIEELLEYSGSLDVSIFACPSDDKERTVDGDKRSYAVNQYLCRNDGLVQNDENPSMLVMLGERSTAVSVIGTNGANNLYGVYNLSEHHDGGNRANVLFLDGHVESMETSFTSQRTPVWWNRRFKGEQD
ncbi:hypothetical protein QEH59_17185 [Coraliomargarita sp. SDUM461004]|uniref:Uncharacterized protein n=1 Tax=Thalassobacterium sedimentorum TaxID=3041258 RepID=A0ABU1APL8_9BACT|nr:hypothetical protein [Coraliomargarita sp. SDUM461004]MDQ8196173.1 hypothetical protein [Coraliomargarita sp. SDUM461004]